MELIPALLLFVVLLAREYTYQMERKENAKERAMLLQRIQAPSVAVVEHSMGDIPPSENGMPLISDEDFKPMMETMWVAPGVEPDEIDFNA